jgi:hypothetical protein
MIDKKQLKKARARAIRAAELQVIQELPCIHLELDEGKIPATGKLEVAVGELYACGGSLANTDLGATVHDAFRRVKLALESLQQGKKRKA